MYFHILVCVAATFFALAAWSIPFEDRDEWDSPFYGPPKENPYDRDNVWPRSITQDVRDFTERHFEHIDTSSGIDDSANDKNCDTFATLFTADATYIFNGQVSTGTDAIKQTCLAIFKAIPYRQHSFIKTYSFGLNTYEVAVVGLVRYGNKSVDEEQRGWVEIFSLKEVEGDIKIQSERVFADPDPA